MQEKSYHPPEFHQIFLNFAVILNTETVPKKYLKMIQRIQSVYLLIVVISGILQFFFPVALYIHPLQGNYELTVTGLKYLGETSTYVNFTATLPMLILTAASVILSLTAIFMYKKRMKQVLVVNIAFLINVILIALIFLLYSNNIFREIVKVEPSYKFGSFFPVVSVIFLVLASTAIKKDESLVRSADRLR